MYFYPAGVSARANQVAPSARGELEITTLNEMYLKDALLDVQLLGRGFAESAQRYGKSPYGAYLKTVAEGKVKY